MTVKDKFSIFLNYNSNQLWHIDLDLMLRLAPFWYNPGCKAGLWHDTTWDFYHALRKCSFLPIVTPSTMAIHCFLLPPLRQKFNLFFSQEDKA